MSILDKITMVPLAADQYFPDETKKTQIYIHHTAGNPDPYSVFKWWASTPDRVATAFIIGGKPTKDGVNWKDGDIVQVFGSGKWAHHLGLKKEHLRSKSNTELNKCSIGIEICSWGQVTMSAKGYLTYTNNVLFGNDVVKYDNKFRGFNYYQAYTQPQLSNLYDLLQFLCQKWNIPKEYKGDAIFDINADALNGVPGIYTHVSVRPDKNDCHPQPELISVLKSL